MTKRNLNARGQNLIDRIEKAIGTILFVVVIIYAGVRGQKFATQLPATYRTTTRPNNIPIDFVNQIFPSNIPDPTYEFPAVTICPEVGALAGIVSCFVTKSPSGIKVPCDDKGMYSRFLPYLGSQVECQTVNDIPGKPLAAENSGDIMMVTVTLTGTSPGSPRSAFVTAHPHGGPTVTPVQSFDNFFAAGTSSMTQVAAK